VCVCGLCVCVSVWCMSESVWCVCVCVRTRMPAFSATDITFVLP